TSGLNFENPITYRGYYYDSYSSTYYLQSRYYNDATYRFINLDSPSIAQQSKDDSDGMNLYAYCNNDPVNFCDISGHAKSNVGTIDYNVTVTNFIKKYNLKQNSFNCYAYAIGIHNKIINPGYKSNKKITSSTSVSTIVEYVISDLKKMGYKGVDVTKKGGANYKTSAHTWLIAVRVGGSKKNYDYHFMIRSNLTKTWSFKAGKAGAVLELVSGLTPGQVKWNMYNPGTRKISAYAFYTSSIKYIAVTG
ncbi:MAG: hypothetical protein NC397_08405, partial [Clostridium sp.]|nr:hypothetical protein [Clostridium sp.]